MTVDGVKRRLFHLVLTDPVYYTKKLGHWEWWYYLEG